VAQAPAFDLQAHSLHSDGELPPAGVVRAAADAGVELFSLTDHDTVDGVDEALEAAHGAGIGLVPGTEVSAIQHDAVDVHILGYRIDHRDPGFLDRLAGFRADRELRAERLADRLGELGWALDRTGIEARRAAGEPVGRPHVAAAVLAHPDNAPRLAAEGLADPGGFIEAYLVAGAPGFVGRTTPTVPEAIEAIHAAGGVAVWAHPFWDVDQPPEALATLERFVAGGLDGVEVFYATHTREQTHLLADRCDELGLLQTGSSDFHGFGHGHFAGFRRFELFGREPVLGPLTSG
jgi:predicted metal-dependent phosphoesterase TrpH